ncbi:MAG TPA: hypothetical protein VJZ70_05530 [Limnochordia bacterium]|nr:hypothetical protein [Limnochordia bacterium]
MKSIRLGFSKFGFLVAFLQLLPNIVWVLFPPEPNILTANASLKPFLEYGEHVLGISIVIMLMFLVGGNDQRLIPRGKPTTLALGAILLYWVGWILYYAGMQGNVVIYSMVVLPPVAFFFAGWAKKTPAISIAAMLFVVFHVLVTLENFPL